MHIKHGKSAERHDHFPNEGWCVEAIHTPPPLFIMYIIENREPLRSKNNALSYVTPFASAG